MIKTQIDIQEDFYRLVRAGSLALAVNGDVYMDAGYRPRDSRKEDIVIVLTSGFSEQVQSGIVTLQVYVPDVDPFGNGVLVMDGERLKTLGAIAAAWVEDMAGRTLYHLALNRAIAVDYNERIGQHFLAVQLRYDYID